MRGFDGDLTSTERERGIEDKKLRIEKIKVFDSKPCGVLDL